MKLKHFLNSEIMRTKTHKNDHTKVIFQNFEKRNAFLFHVPRVFIKKNRFLGQKVALYLGHRQTDRQIDRYESENRGHHLRVSGCFPNFPSTCHEEAVQHILI